MIKYDRESYEWAKKILLPSTVEAEKSVKMFPMNDILRMSASLLLDDIDTWNKVNYVKKYAYHVMSSFSKQLNNEGKYEFGECSILSLVPGKYLDGELGDG